MKAILEKTEIDEISSDSDMVNATLNGDKSAFGELVCKYQKKVYRLAYRIIGNPTDSADIIQETFVHAYQNLDHLKNHGKFFHWLCQIAKNQCLDWIRKRQNNLVAIEDELISDSLYLPPAPDEILIEQEFYDQVMKAIEDLPEHNRKVVKMFYLDGKSYSEIQNELGITKGTLGRWLYEARLELIKASKHFAGIIAFRFDDFMSKIFTGTSVISTTKCLVISIALHLVIFAQLSGNGIGYHANKGNSYNNSFIQSSAENLMSVEYIPTYSQISTSGLSSFNKRDNILKQKSMVDNDKKTMSLHTVAQSIKSISLSQAQNSVLVPLPQHNIDMRYNNPSLTYGESLQSEKSSMNPIRMKGNAKPIQLISSKVLPVSKGLSEMQTDETQKPNINAEIESNDDFEHYVLVRSFPDKPNQSILGYSKKLAVDNNGNIYVSTWENAIMKISSEGQLLKTWGGKGSNDGQFRAPMGIAVDNSGNIYVADSGNFRVQKFDSEGNFLVKFGKNGYKAKELNEPFKNPADVAVDKSGNVYVVDSANHCVHKFDSNGVWRHRWGERGSRDGQFRHPTCVAVDGKGYVYVADDQNLRIQKFTSDGRLCGGSLGIHRSPRSGIESMRLTGGMAGDESGNLFVVDTLNRYVKKLGAQYMSRIAGWGQKSVGYDPYWIGESRSGPDDGFVAPSDIAIDKDGNVYVLDSWRIKIFRPANK